MKLDDLKQDWQKTVETNPSSEDLSEVMIMLEKETKKVDKEIKRRDILEISIALLLIPFWIWGLFHSAGLIQTIGYGIAIVSCLYIPYKLVSAKRIKPSKNSNIKSYLETERQKVQQQKQLLESIVWWYIAPLTTAIVLITLGGTVNESGIPQLNDYLIKYYGFLTLLVAGIYLLNKRAAKKKFAPLLENINHRLTELNS